MTKILVAIGVSVISFAAGIMGMYFLLPMILPHEGGIDPAGSSIHSTAPDSTEHPDSATPAATANPATPAATANPVTPTVRRPAPETNTTPLPAPSQPAGKALADSLARIRQQYDRLRSENEALRKRLQNATSSANARPAANKASATDLSTQLAKLNQKELKEILGQLDNASLEMLYAQASGRNRAKLLQAMPADRAARFVNKMTTGNPGTTATPARPVASTAQPASK